MDVVNDRSRHRPRRSQASCGGWPPLPHPRARYRPVVVAVALSLTGVGCSDEEPTAQVFRLSSPDGRLSLAATLGGTDAADGASDALRYTLEREGVALLQSSPLGIVTDRASFVDGLSLVRSESREIHEPYRTRAGKRLDRIVAGNELTLTLVGESGDELDVIFRAHDDGVAVRYRLVGTGDVVVRQEHTGFRLVEGSTGFMMPYDVQGVFFLGTYEQMPSEMAAGEPTSATGWAYPALFEVGPTEADGAPWLLLTEAALGESYCGTRLAPEPEGTLYRVTFPVEQEGNGVGEVEPRDALPLETPWRVIMAGDLATIVGSTLVDDLSPPSLVEDPSWIEPGRAAWSWLTQDTGDVALQQQYVEFAAEMGWEYVLVDAKWDQWPDVASRMPGLIDTARASSVDVLLWYNSGGEHNSILDATPRDRMLDRATRRAEMQRISDWGAAGIKVDFFESDKQDRIQQYLAILQDAADFQLLVNFHGATLPRGWQRTYPNLMTHEAVRGAEYFRQTEIIERPNADTHLFYLFARNVVGPMDYTPVVFEDGLAESELPYSHSLAQAVLFESGLQHFADQADQSPNAGYRAVFARFPFVAELLSLVPVAWDDTRLLEGSPRTHAVVARRAGDIWWLAGIAGTDDSVEVSAALTFLGGGDFECRLVTQDPADPRGLVHTETILSASSTVDVSLSPRDGFLARLAPAP